MKKAVIDINTGITQMIEMTEDEISAYQTYKTKADAEIENYLNARSEAITKRAAAEAKLAALGLTADDLKALGL